MDLFECCFFILVVKKLEEEELEHLHNLAHLHKAVFENALTNLSILNLISKVKADLLFYRII